MAKADYLIKGGTVIDCYQKIYKTVDIAVRDGVIVDADEVQAAHVIDAEGCLVTPGLIDFHCHLGYGLTDLGIPGEASAFPSGVTTAVDAGTSGTANYQAFREMTLRSRLRIKAFLNVCPAGLVTTAYHENIDPSCFQPSKIIRFLRKYNDQLLGLKIRQSAEIAGNLGLAPLEAALEIAQQAHCPVAVHTTNPPVPAGEIARLLRKDDIYIHVYQGKGETVVRNGKIVPEVLEARRRGVVFDAANGTNHFSLAVAEACLQQGFEPDIISTDLTRKSLYIPGKVFSLPFIMAKYLALGMPLEKIVACTTLQPAAYLGQAKELGSLCEGTCADIAVFRLADHPVTFQDFSGKSVTGTKLLKTQLTMREGEVVFRQVDF